MRFVTLSDTHCRHKKLRDLPAGDVLIHAGDITSKGSYEEVADFLRWFGKLDYRHKVFIAGNHDFLFERASREALGELIPENVTYLNDSSTLIEGIHLWGSPVTPWFHDWAFNRNRGADIARHWEQIPPNTDILIVHGPAWGILDFTVSSIHAGCEELRKAVEKIKPAYFISGHIHEGYGQTEHNGTHFINASVLNERYQLRNKPVVFDYGK